MSTKKQPGPWRIERWSGGEGYRAGFYLARTLPGGAQEWMRSAQNPAKARRFMSEGAALAAIPSAAA